MDSSSFPPPPAGWYEDPEGSNRLRWWDGEKWGPLQPDASSQAGTTGLEAAPDDESGKKPPSATPGLILAIVSLFFLWSPLWALLIASVSIFMAFRAFRHELVLPRDRSNSKIAIGISALSFVLALLFLSDNSGSPKPDTNTIGSNHRPGSDQPFVPSDFAELSEREYALLTKDPTARKGDKIVIQGVVTQFDSNTGSCTFRANTDVIEHSRSWEYNENTFIAGANEATCDHLEKNVVSGDHFKAWVQVNGVVRYKTQLGGTMTALELDAFHIEAAAPLD